MAEPYREGSRLACPRCGAPLDAGDLYCGACGASQTRPVDIWSQQPVLPPPDLRAWTPYGRRRAEWWPRVGAMLLDGVLLLIPSFTVSAAIAGRSQGLEFVALLAISGCYFGLLNGTGSGATVGNRAANIGVRDAQSDTVIGAGRGFLRWFVRFALYLLLIPGLLNDLWPLWDRQRQTLADKAANSTMVRLT